MRPQTARKCPICKKIITHLNKHLKNVHKMSWEEKLLFLRKWNIREEPCPLNNCGYHGKRLDVHLKCSHKELSHSKREKVFALVRRTKVVRELAALRASRPDLMLVSTLDLEVEAHSGEDTGGRTSAASTSGTPGANCKQELNQTKMALQEASEQLQQEREENHRLKTEATRRGKWVCAINRAHVNADGSIDVSNLPAAHFISGEKKNDPCHVDYGPSTFPQHENGFVTKSAAKIDYFQLSINGFKEERVEDVPAESTNLQLLILASPTTSTDQQQDLLNIKTEEVCLKTENLTEVSESTGQPPEPPETSGPEMLYSKINNLCRERDEALEHVSSLENLLSVPPLTSSSVEENDSACQMMTGITWKVFQCLFTFLSRFLKPCATAKVPLREQLFLTLLKLRHNLTFESLADLNGVPKSTIIDHFWEWVDLMYSKLSFLIKWADRETVFKIVPPVFKNKFPRLTSIIHCFEVFVESPEDLRAHAQGYSSYKKHITVKFFISCNPVGAINFLSKAWGGRASDVQIVRESGFISHKYHSPGDQILADRGFTLHDEFAATCRAELITPSLTEGKKQLSAQEVEQSISVSSVRIHMERVIGLIKNRYSILKGTLPVPCVQSLKDESMNATVSSCDKIITVCAALTNLGPSIVFKE